MPETQRSRRLCAGDERVVRDSFKRGVAEHGGLEVSILNPESAVPRPVCLGRDVIFETGKHLPVAGQLLNVSVRDSAPQMTIDVLQVFEFRAVDVARNVEVVVVLGVTDLIERHQERVPVDF